MVSVLSKEGNPLMPCENVVARLLLKQKKARVKMTTPFVIQLNYETTNYYQVLIGAMDTGSRFVGSAVLDEKNNVMYMSQTEIRNDVTENMTERSKHRRSRRNRKIRYRKCRFLNRKNSIKTDRFSPTMKSKFDSHEKEINFISKIFPITKWKIETGTFDPHALKNPEVLNNPLLYQQGTLYGHRNMRAYILDRDNYICQCCKGKRKEKRLQVHHLTFKKDWGSGDEKNLLTLCLLCHDDVHEGKIDLKLKGKKKGQLKHATQMNSIRIQILKRFPEAEETFGFITKEYRQILDLPKGALF